MLSWILYPRRSAKKLMGLAIFVAVWVAVVAATLDFDWGMALWTAALCAALWALWIAYLAIRWILCDFINED